MKSWLIKRLGGVTASDHQWFVNKLLGIISKHDAAFIIRSDTNV